MSKGGRPSKLTQKFIEAVKSVIDNPNSYILKDTDILFLANDKLEPEERISERTFKEYKAGKELDSVEQDILDKFSHLIKKARQMQKINLMDSMLDNDTKSWQARAWILERKEPDLNIRKKVELEAKVEVADFEFDTIQEE